MDNVNAVEKEHTLSSLQLYQLYANPVRQILRLFATEANRSILKSDIGGLQTLVKTSSNVSTRTLVCKLNLTYIFLGAETGMKIIPSVRAQMATRDSCAPTAKLAIPRPMQTRSAGSVQTLLKTYSG